MFGGFSCIRFDSKVRSWFHAVPEPNS